MKDEIPEGWAVVALEELLLPAGLFDGPFGSNLKTSDYVEAGVRVVRLENLGHLQFVAGKQTFISQRKYASLIKHRVCEGDIIFGSFVDGDVRVCILPPLDTLAIAKADCFCIRPNEDLADRRCLMYCLATPNTRDALIDQIHGATRPRVNTRQLRQLRILLPPLGEQQRIAEKVTQLLGKVLTSCARLERVPYILKKFRNAVLAAAGDGRLTADWRKQHKQTLRDWHKVKIVEILAEPLANGRSVPDAQAGFPVLRLTCLKEGRIDLRERKIGAWDAESADRFTVAKGDFFVARGSGSLSLVGRGGLLEETPDAVAYPDTMIRIRVRAESVSPKFLRLAWNTPMMRDQIESTARTTAGIWKISQGDIEGFEIMVPPIREQEEIIRRVQALHSVTDRLEVRQEKAKTQVSRLTQSILAKAFRGEIVPTEAALSRSEGREFETATELLDRIKNMRAKQLEYRPVNRQAPITKRSRTKALT